MQQAFQQIILAWDAYTWYLRPVHGQRYGELHFCCKQVTSFSAINQWLLLEGSGHFQCNQSATFIARNWLLLLPAMGCFWSKQAMAFGAMNCMLLV